MVSWFRRNPKRLRRPIGRPRAAGDAQAVGAIVVAPLPNSMAGGFLTVTNKGPADDRLVAASSPLAERIEIHGIKVVGADIDMRPMANGVALPAGHTMTLKPRGYHLLCMGLKAPLAKGSTPAGHPDLREGRHASRSSSRSRSPA